MRCYSEAISVSPRTSTYYGNRSACYLMLEEYGAALEDIERALEIEAENPKFVLRKVRCLIHMKRILVCSNK